MAPLTLIKRADGPGTPTKSLMTENADIVEGWAEGFQLEALVILMLICICNLRRHVLLHKLILLEQFLATWKGVVIFFSDPVYGWFLSSTVILLYISYFLHNYISWMKIRPFLERRSTIIYLGSLIFVQPYWAVATWTNFANFNGLGHDHYRQVRPWETLARDPWWIFTTCYLVYVLKTRFDCGFFALIGSSPRFGIMIFCMSLSIGFLIADFVSVMLNLHHANGLNPFWRLALIFKCASDTIFLDDFKRVFDVLGVNAIHNNALDRRQIGLVSEPNTNNSLAKRSESAPADMQQHPVVIVPRISGNGALSRPDYQSNGAAVEFWPSPSSASGALTSYEEGRRSTAW